VDCTSLEYPITRNHKRSDVVFDKKPLVTGGVYFCERGLHCRYVAFQGIEVIELQGLRMQQYLGELLYQMSLENL